MGCLVLNFTVYNFNDLNPQLGLLCSLIHVIYNSTIPFFLPFGFNETFTTLIEIHVCKLH